MRHVTRLSLAIAVCTLTACANLWAGGIARDVAKGLSSIKSYSGVTVETGIADTPIERTVLYGKPWKIRVETTTPGPHAGELFVYDGDTITLWYPQQLFGVRIHGAHPPSDRELLHHIERQTRTNLAAYTFALEDDGARVAGQRAMHWLVRPARRAPFRMTHHVWNHDPTTLPLQMQFVGDDKRLWYSFAFESLAFDVPVPDDAFTVTFPKNAVIFEWNLDDPGISVDDAREEMNFKVQLPTRLPAGHAVNKIVKSPHCLPMIAVSMDHDGSSLSLIESRYSGLEQTPLGLDVTVGDVPAKLSFMGSFVTVSWVKDNTLLTLTGNLDFPTMLDVAASVN